VDELEDLTESGVMNRYPGFDTSTEELQELKGMAARLRQALPLRLGSPFDALPKGADGRRGWEAYLGLHSKGAKQAAKAAARAGGAAGKRRGRPAKSAHGGETEAMKSEQMGLGL